MRQYRAHTVVIAAGLAGGILLAAAGCEKNSPATPHAAPATSQAAEDQPVGNVLPELPKELEVPADAGMEIVIANPYHPRSEEENSYRIDPEIPVGRLLGACKFADKIRPNLPAAEPVDLAGAEKITDPQPGELEYYQNLKLKQRQYFSTYQKLHPNSVVLRIRDVRKGRLSMPDRATFLVREGRFRPHVQVGPIGERSMFGTYDGYPTQFVVRRMADSQIVHEGLISAFDRDTIKPLGGGGLHFTARPTMSQTPVLETVGAYEVRAPRHPWKAAYLFVVDNPYAVVADGDRFEMENVPVGRWTVDVWHPAYAPVQDSYEIEIRKNETTELGVLFYPPAELKAPQEQTEK